MIRRLLAAFVLAALIGGCGSEYTGPPSPGGAGGGGATNTVTAIAPLENAGDNTNASLALMSAPEGSVIGVPIGGGAQRPIVMTPAQARAALNVANGATDDTVANTKLAATDIDSLAKLNGIVFETLVDDTHTHATLPTTDEKAALDGAAAPAAGNVFATMADVGAAGGGTVTSVSLSGTEGIDVVSGSPVTTSGTIVIGSTKLAGIEPGATADQTGAEIKVAYEAEPGTNAFTDADLSDLGLNTTHRGLTTNPHAVTKAQVGLGNVDNTSDLSKPISTATQTALDAKAATADARFPTADQKAGLDAATAGPNPPSAGNRVATQADVAAGGGGDVSAANGPLTGEIARWTSSNTIEGLTESEFKAAVNLEPGIDIAAQVHQHTEADITDLGSYPDATGQLANKVAQTDGANGWTFIATPTGSGTEVNDLTAAVTWANVPDVNITQSSVTQHQAALSIIESQISDLAHVDATARADAAAAKAKTDLLTVSQPVDLDTVESDTATNNAKISYTDAAIVSANQSKLAGIESGATADQTATNSVEFAADNFQLVGDLASPGANQVYGTDGSGVKGWKADPLGGGGQVDAVIAGSHIAVDSVTDPTRPVVSIPPQLLADFNSAIQDRDLVADAAKLDSVATGATNDSTPILLADFNPHIQDRDLVADSIKLDGIAAGATDDTALNAHEALTDEHRVMRIGPISGIGAAVDHSGEYYLINDTVVPDSELNLMYSDGSVWQSIRVPFASVSGVLQNTVVGRTAAGTGAAELLNGADLAAIVAPFDGTLQGTVPATSGNDPAKALLGDGTWGGPQTPLANIQPGTMANLEAIVSTDVDVIIASRNNEFVSAGTPLTTEAAETDRALFETGSPTFAKQYAEVSKFLGVSIEDIGTAELHDTDKELFRALNFTNLTTVGNGDGAFTPNGRTLDIALPTYPSGAGNNIGLGEWAWDATAGTPANSTFRTNGIATKSSVVEIQIPDMPAKPNVLSYAKKYLELFKPGDLIILQASLNPDTDSASFRIDSRSWAAGVTTFVVSQMAHAGASFTAVNYTLLRVPATGTYFSEGTGAFIDVTGSWQAVSGASVGVYPGDYWVTWSGQANQSGSVDVHFGFSIDGGATIIANTDRGWKGFGNYNAPITLAAKVTMSSAGTIALYAQIPSGTLNVDAFHMAAQRAGALSFP